MHRFSIHPESLLKLFPLSLDFQETMTRLIARGDFIGASFCRLTNISKRSKQLKTLSQLYSFWSQHDHLKDKSFYLNFQYLLSLTFFLSLSLSLSLSHLKEN